MTGSVANAIQELANTELANGKNSDTAADVLFAITSLLADMLLRDDNEDDRLDAWLADTKVLACEMAGGHDWIYDQCGYWGHQYCCKCDTPKYVDLAVLGCNEAVKRIGKISEKDYEENLMQHGVV